MTLFGGIAAALFVVIFIFFYNSLVQRKNETETCWGAIDAYLKKRFDLVPNLVASVQQYMQHERSTLENIVQMREQAMRGGMTTEGAAEMDASMTGALRNLMARAESYPELKSNQNFLQLQASLNEIEEQLSAARRAYNSSVSSYNNGVEMLPSNLIAALMGYKRKSVLITAEAEKANQDVHSLFNRKTG